MTDVHATYLTYIRRIWRISDAAFFNAERPRLNIPASDVLRWRWLSKFVSVTFASLTRRHDQIHYFVGTKYYFVGTMYYFVGRMYYVGRMYHEIIFRGHEIVFRGQILFRGYEIKQIKKTHGHKPSTVVRAFVVHTKFVLRTSMLRHNKLMCFGLHTKVTSNINLR